MLYPLMSLEVAKSEKHQFDVVVHMQKSPTHKPLLVECSSPFIRLAEYLEMLRAWCKQYLPGLRQPDVLRIGVVGM